MDFTQENIKVASASINNSIEAIKKLRENCGTADIYEVAQGLLMDKFKLSQTEASEIVEDLKSGIESYTTLYKKMGENPEEVVKENIISATSSMNKEEKVRYLASMLSALELAATPDLSQEMVENKLNSNLQKNEEELIDETVKALGSLPLETLSQTIEQLDSNTIKEIAKAIEMNTTEFRFFAALQLYITQREGTIKLSDADVKLTPSMIGALSAGAVDAILATSALKEGEINLERWQEIVKFICGVLFAIAVTGLTVVGLVLLTLPIMDIIWSIFGVGIMAMVMFSLIFIPLTWYGTDKATDAMIWMLEKLDPIFDKVIVRLTEVIKNTYEKILEWVKAYYKKEAITQASESISQEKQPIQETQDEQLYSNNAPVMA
jgi:hypothetical protein